MKILRLMLPLLALFFSVSAFAQTPMTPVYPRDNNASGSTITSFLPSVLPSSTAVLSANRIVKAAPGNLYSFEVSADATLSGAAWWIMIYDSATVPADGASQTPIKCYALTSGTTLYERVFAVPLNFRNGIVIGVSTTGCFTKTESVHAFISGDGL
jgi:hypothetical protein